MKQRLTTLSLMLCMFLGLQAQELTVKSFSEAGGDLSASKSENRRIDKSGGLCGLIKVQLPLDGVSFDGAFVIGDVKRKADGYWVYMNKGAYQLHIMHPSFHPLELNLRELQPAASEGFRGVQPLCTYKLVVNAPSPTDKEEKKQKLIINYTPKNATVLIDSKLCSNNGRAEVELSLGEHSYIIAADGYITAEGMVKLNGGKARTLTEQLEKEGASVETQKTSRKPQGTASSSTGGANGTELAVESMEMAPMDLSASTHQRKDFNGVPCALVKVQSTIKGMMFEGNVMGTVENKTIEYWVYMTDGSYMLRVKHPNFKPLMVNFRDYGISGVKPKTTYVLKIQ